MAGGEAIILEVAGRQHGACARAQLLERGMSRSSIDRRLRSGLLIPFTRGVYLVAGTAESPQAIGAAALLATPRGVLSHWTAAGLHGFPLELPRSVHLLIHRDTPRPRLGAGLTVHETRLLPRSDVATVDDLRVTSPARTLCDLATWLRPARLRYLCEQRFLLASPSPEEVIATHRSLCRRGRPGTAALRGALDELLDDEPFPESQLELAMLRLLVDAALDGFRRQFRPPWFDGERGVVDFADPRARLVIEADGRRWHTARQAFDQDRRRDRAAARHGWHVLRFGWQEVVHRPDEVVEEIRAIRTSHGGP